MLLKLTRAICFLGVSLFGLRAIGLLPSTETAYADVWLLGAWLVALIGWEAFSTSNWRFGQVRQHLQMDAEALDKIRTIAVEKNKEGHYR